VERRLADRTLNAGLRVLLGVIGLAALAAALIVAGAELRHASPGSSPIAAALVALVAGVVALGGGLLIRGALRGRIAVRSPRFRR